MNVILPDYSQSQVLVVGDIMLDRYWHGSTNRISPEAPVPVVKVNESEERPGGAANVAMNITSLGGNVRLIGLTGVDEAAKILDEQLTKQRVVCDFVPLSSHPTITKLRVLARNQQLIRLDFEEGFCDVDPTLLLERVKQALPNVKVMVLSDYAKGVLTSVQQMIQLAKQANIPVLIDPKGADFERYRGATLLTPNMSEFEAVVGHCADEDVMVEKGYELIEKYDLKGLLITRSEKGMTLLQLGKQLVHLPTQAKEVFDVTGAGDTVIASLAASLAAGTSIEEGCFLANAAAGVVVGKLGTSTVSQVELEDAIRARTHTGFGVMTEDELQEEVRKARLRGEKIVMTNGCFDILHAGHVSYLDNARKLGDRLIVAVNSDTSVKVLKGPSRPINPLMQRMIVLGALSSVDWVVPFEEDTPQRLIAKILPDVLAKGGDYKPEQIAGGAEVIAAGGEVKIMNFEDGCSTTNIVNAIKKLS
ncbi:bifunctional D-glycero-beta-D-manno-heptose-7-phosphate kinase/D-glycero-beta-D-manno-heptose 1-phosphate adenylyltransferase HldE [Zophobihabitans entericus]|uniref:Bifunctional protein HldE n=1 Tax=Zophobihabitans entericus TaxID=1635327 RepID=A0A6G9IDA7_9GAMM|nr:bifunctional D-glycero-beta-D-manno-heptose-7-phosphate kinase/D-glycero-beta-D-manno-heptose 1-phosphate adenylyltransferase HldE [Zophobihabitans entericus]QIQ22221.1 bifunctional D-glycero-beta-D-manno-heptose-7-phosphate kinase/D-glycero-beta-D-manno-heptose 1-phosphate adenylyltransferase HldE [Zophobihabitans entericus]